MAELNDLCEWPIDAECWGEVPEGREPAAKIAVNTAVEVLWALTARQFGQCLYDFDVRHDGVCRPCTPDRGTGCRIVDLPGPVAEVVSVTGEKGEVVPFRVHGEAVHIPGGTPPVGTIRYLQGDPVPVGGQRAAGTLSHELFLRACGSQKCRLPARTQSVNRQGVSVQMADLDSMIANGGTGLPDVDMWIRSVNPNGHAMLPEVIG